MSSSAENIMEGGQQPLQPITNPFEDNRFIYEKFAGRKGFSRLKERMMDVMTDAHYKTWLATISFQPSAEKRPYPGVEQVAKKRHRQPRKIQIDYREMQDLAILALKSGWEKVGRQMVKIIYKDFTNAYTLANEYDEWVTSGQSKLYPPDRDTAEIIKADPKLYRKLRRFAIYHRVLDTNKPGPIRIPRMEPAFPYDDDISDVDTITHSDVVPDVVHDSPYRVYSKQNTMEEENSNSRTHPYYFNDEIRRQEENSTLGGEEELSQVSHSAEQRRFTSSKAQFSREEVLEHSYYSPNIHIAHEIAPQANPAGYMNYDEAQWYEEENQQSQQYYQDPYLPPPADYHYSEHDPLPPGSYSEQQRSYEASTAQLLGNEVSRQNPPVEDNATVLCNNEQASSDHYTSYSEQYAGELSQQGYDDQYYAYAPEPAIQSEPEPAVPHTQLKGRLRRPLARRTHKHDTGPPAEPAPQLREQDQAQTYDPETEQTNAYLQYQEMRAAREQKKYASAGSKGQSKVPRQEQEKIRAYLPRAIEDKLIMAASDLEDLAYESSRTQCAKLFETHRAMVGQRYYFAGELEQQFADMMQISYTKTYARRDRIETTKIGYFFKVFRRDLKTLWTNEEKHMDQSNYTSQNSIQYGNIHTDGSNIIVDADDAHSISKPVSIQETTIILDTPEIQLARNIKRLRYLRSLEVLPIVRELLPTEDINIVGEEGTCGLCGGIIHVSREEWKPQCVGCHPLDHWPEFIKDRIEQILKAVPTIETATKLLLEGDAETIKLLN
jgi:hypothetical protein